ncbi:hypothetical protein [Helicobacter sp. 11S02596-1]|uniref:hypothetical protein n=1 Tax=Helicobacter sp. 11S02596-1 TaxID=1476194 RepID=UPI000BA5A385|nr:hypothetical protein [Helicobacter sp. 11S02596-1]PAF42820.1 hypothetical protein BJI48_06090 [Helicobacter sp. 11S02596-1]
MKKIVVILCSIAFLAGGILSAQPLNGVTHQSSFTQNMGNTLSNADQNLIFGESVNAMVLGDEEMQSTQGFGWFSSWYDFGKIWAKH